MHCWLKSGAGTADRMLNDKGDATAGRDRACVADPLIQRALRRAQAGEHPPCVELRPQGAVEPLDLPRGRRGPGLGQQMLHPVPSGLPVDVWKSRLTT